MATASKNTPTIAANVDGATLTLTFANGKTLIVDAAKLSDRIHLDAMMHGLKQKLVDAAAIARNPDTGASATVEDKINAVCEVYERITAPDGTWNKQRGDGTGPATGGMLLRAMAALTGKTLTETQEVLDSLSDDEVKALRNAPKIKAKMEEFRKPKPNVPGVDVDALLSKFGV